MPEGYTKYGQAHQPSMLRNDRGRVEGRDFIVEGGSAWLITRAVSKNVANGMDQNNPVEK